MEKERKIWIIFSLLLFGSLASLDIKAQDAWSLEQCVARGLEKNLDIQRNQLNRDISEINLKQDQYSRVPDLNVGATHGYNWGQTIDPFTNQFASDRVRNNNFYVQSNVMLFSGFQIRNRIKQSAMSLEASELDVRLAKNNVGLAIAQAYLNVLFAKEQMRAVEVQLSVSERQETRMQRMVDAGQEALSSLMDVQSQLASDRFSVVQAENTLEITKLGLANLLLLDPTEMSTFDVQAPSVDPDANAPLLTVTEIYTQALTALPDVQAAQLRTTISEKGLEIAQGGRSPQLSIRGSIGSGYSGNNRIPVGDQTSVNIPIGEVQNSGDLVIAENRFYTDFETKEFSEQLVDNFNQSLSFNLNFPVFSGLQVSSEISRAKVNFELNRLTEQDTRNVLLQNVQQAHADARAAKKSQEAAQLALDAMTLNFSNAEKRFEQGLISTVDYNDVKSRLAQSEVEAIRAKYDYIFRTTIIDFYMGNTIKID